MPSVTLSFSLSVVLDGIDCLKTGFCVGLIVAVSLFSVLPDIFTVQQDHVHILDYFGFQLQMYYF